MATQKQIDANRRNAQKSTGPITEAGKSNARFNALKHGMTAQVAVLPHEDADSYEQLREALVADHQPVGAVEGMLVELVAVNYWRLLRARRVETASLDLQIRTVKRRHDLSTAPAMDDDGSIAASFAEPVDTFRNLERYQNGIERSYFRAVEALRRAQATRLKPTRPPATSVIGFVSIAKAVGSNAKAPRTAAEHNDEAPTKATGNRASRQPFYDDTYGNDVQLL